MEKPRFQFRLRTIFVVMTLAAICVAVPVTSYVIRVREEAGTEALQRQVEANRNLYARVAKEIADLEAQDKRVVERIEASPTSRQILEAHPNHP